MGALKQGSQWEAALGWVGGESSRGSGGQGFGEESNTTLHYTLEMTAIKLGSKILELPFPVHFSEDLSLLRASV